MAEITRPFLPPPPRQLYDERPDIAQLYAYVHDLYRVLNIEADILGNQEPTPTPPGGGGDGEGELAPPQLASFDVTPISSISPFWRIEWEVADPEEGVATETFAGIRVAYRAGAWSSFDDLTALHSGLLDVSPWDISLPDEDGVYTFGGLPVGEDGGEGDPILVYAISPPTTAFLLQDNNGKLLKDSSGDFIIDNA